MRILFFLVPIVGLPLASCSFNPMSIDDPQKFAGVIQAGPTAPDIIKSLRCEIVTFIVANRIRSELADRALFALRGDPLKKVLPAIHQGLPDYKKQYDNAIAAIEAYRTLDLDPHQYAQLNIDFKNTIAYNASFPWDIKNAGAHGNARTSRYGPGSTDTRTSQLTEPIAIRQDADLGPKDQPLFFRRPNANFDNLLTQVSFLFAARDETSIDEDSAYCYKSFNRISPPYSTQQRQEFSREKKRPHSVVVSDALKVIQKLVIAHSDLMTYAQFTRVYVGLDGITLAKWLQDQATAERPKLGPVLASSLEAVDVGQYVYQMTLNVKPTFSTKYTLIASALNPFAPEFSFTPEHAISFAIFLNTKISVGALAAKTGSSCIGTDSGAKPNPIDGCPDPARPKPKDETNKEILKENREILKELKEIKKLLSQRQ